jgi:hypothetical protein
MTRALRRTADLRLNVTEHHADPERERSQVERAAFAMVPHVA